MTDPQICGRETIAVLDAILKSTNPPHKAIHEYTSGHIKHNLIVKWLIFTEDLWVSNENTLKFDSLKHATNDGLADLMNLGGVDGDEVVIFQDKHGVLKTNNIKWNDIEQLVLGADTDNIPVFIDGGKNRDWNITITSIRDEIENPYLDV